MKPVTMRPFSALTGDDLETATERAAIREFDGGQSRAEAERKAAYEMAYAKAGRPLPHDFESKHA